jgi:hypothetical protein
VLHLWTVGEALNPPPAPLGTPLFLQVQVQCICGREKLTDTLCRSNCGLATFREELLPLKQNRNYVLLLQQSASLHALHAPQNYNILRFSIQCTYVLSFLPHKTLQLIRPTLNVARYFLRF